MLVFGTEKVYFSHLPMFHAPHDYQAVIEVELPEATKTLMEIATGKVVVTGQTFSRVSFDNPGQQQRFARARGQRDAENRAAQVIADNIKSRLASYFVAGT